MKVRAVVATQDRPRGPHAPAVRAPRRTRHRAGCAVPPLPENTAAHVPWASATQMPHSRRRGRWFPRAPPAPSSRQRANVALTGSGSISLPHIPGTPCRGNISAPCVLEGQVVAIFRRGAFSGGRPWQDFAPMRSRAAGRSIIPPRCLFRTLVDGRTLAKCVPQRPTVARLCPDAFSGCRPWQDIAAVRSQAAIRGGFFASCVPEGASDGKSAPSWQHIAAVHPKRAGFGKICAPCIRKAPQTGVRGCTARIPCHEGALFAARTPQIMHGARILPSFGVWTGKNRAKPKNCRRFDKNTFKSSH